MRALLALCISMLLLSSLYAADFRWSVADGSYQAWNDAANWGDAGAYPSTADDKVVGDKDISANCFDLGGTWAIGTISDTTWAWKRRPYKFRNGSLSLVSGTSKFSTFADLYITNATLITEADAWVSLGHSDHGSGEFSTLTIDENGLWEVRGVLIPACNKLTVKKGGCFRYTATAKADNANATKNWEIDNYGTLDWPNGFCTYINGWSFFPVIRQYGGGEWILGNNILGVNNIYFRIELYGGTLTVTNNVNFYLKAANRDNNPYAKFMPDADLTFDVAEGCTLDMATSTSSQIPFVYEVDENGDNFTKITRKGAGTVLLADMPYSLDLQGGTTLFSVNTRSAMGSLKVGAGQSFSVVNANTVIETFEGNAGTVTIAVPGLSIGAVAENADISGTFQVVASAFNDGDVVVTVADEALRGKIKSDLASVFENAGVELMEEGASLVVGSSSYVFDSSEITDLDDPSGWRTGLPPAGKDVVVSGEGVIADVSASLTNSWNSIMVQDGATLKISGSGLSLPPLVLKGEARLYIDGDHVVSSLDTYEFDGDIPTLKVGEGAMLTVPAGYKFKNVKLVLCEQSTLTESGDGALAFGYAGGNEVSRFSMYATNATITALNEAAVENGSRIDFASPAAGGTVEVIGEIVLKDVTFTYTGKDGFAFGLNNPADKAFRVVADGTALDIAQDTYIAGGANLVLTNNSVLFRKRSTKNEHDSTPENTYNIYIRDYGKVTLADGGEIRTTVTLANATESDGRFGLGVISLEPAEEGFVGLEILEGGVGCWWRTYGDNTGVIRYDGGIQKVFRGHWWGNVLGGNRSRIFNRLKGVEIAQGSTLLLQGFHDDYRDNDDTLHPFYIDSPFTGGGNLFVTNTYNGKVCEPHIISGANTCTGTIKALECAGSASTAIYFADGANWAGTVAADGRIKLENADAPVSVTFGTLDLQAEFPIKVWIQEDGSYVNDVLNAGNYLNNGGRIVPELADGEGEFAFGDRLELGKIAKGATLPALGKGWVARTSAIEGDSANDALALCFGVGMVIFVK